MFSGDHQNFHTDDSRVRESKTIVVEKIPEEHLSLEDVNGWFKKFGTVTNVAVDAVGGKALVSFSMHEEALAAWKAEEAVFNNRFIRIFWHRPMEGQGSTGARMLQASAPLIANLSTRDNKTTPPDAAKPAVPATPSVPKVAATSVPEGGTLVKTKTLRLRPPVAWVLTVCAFSLVEVAISSVPSPRFIIFGAAKKILGSRLWRMSARADQLAPLSVDVFT